MASPPPLPIDAVLPDLCAALTAGPRVVLHAPPGAGKTTRAPLALLDQAWRRGGKILLLEPRRLATRAAASRLAQQLNTPLGGRVGYRVRHTAEVSAATEIEVLTTGLYLRRLQDDPGLEGVAAVLFDEVHERAADLDLALALTLDAAGLRDDLRLVAMSATLDGAAVQRLFGDGTPLVRAQGRQYPVETVWLGRPTARVPEAMAAAIRQALNDGPGDVLAFLPGQGEIHRTAQALGRIDAAVLPLYGDMPLEAQDRVLKPGTAGERRVVLATAIAETSLTIEGVAAVVDCGLARVPRFDPASGMSRLMTVPVSQATAEQRSGRAGRLGPGRCYRLWSEAEHRGLSPFPAPEVVSADLAPLALAAAEWGVAVPDLAWLDPPPAGALGQATALLAELRAVDASGRITAHGRKLARLPLHPRLGHMLVRADALGLGSLGADLAAVLGERDFLADRDADLTRRIEALQRGQGDPAARQRIRQSADQMRGLLGIRRTPADPQAVGLLVALAYPDRLGQARGAPGQFRMSGGGAAQLPATDALAACRYLAIADLDGDRTNAKIYRAASLDEATVEAEFADQIQTIDRIFWDQAAVQARRQRRFGQLVLRDQPLPNPAPDAVLAAVIAAIRVEPTLLPWSDSVRSLQQRVGLLHTLEPDLWPDWSETALLASLEDWLAPHLTNVARAGQLAQLPLAAILADQLEWAMRQRLDADAPTHLAVPSGSRIALDYSGERPVLAVKLQEMFSATASPTIARGRVVVQVHLLSPARRPVQVTDDLAGFWTGSYRAVRADLRGRYPKHPWPEDPLSAVPTARTKARAP